MSAHVVVPAPDTAQVWLDSGEALPDELMRVDVVDCTGLRFRTLSSWDGQGWAVKCHGCGGYADCRIGGDR